jgi:putative membrane protein
MTKPTTMLLRSIAILGALSGCSKSDSGATTPAASQGDEATPAEASMQGKSVAPTDGQIVQILATVDTGEIEQAQLATSRATSPQVRQFATEMIDQHTESRAKGAQLAAQAGLSLAGSKQGDELHAKGAQTKQDLQNSEPTAFDDAYMQAQVKQHQEVLDLIDTKLTPAATNPDVRATLTTTRGMVQHHLTEAQQIAGSLGH